MQRLPIEPISQASENQRAGRAGRLADGVAIRLYSEEDLVSRPEFTDPEILRTNLASVILAMTNLGLGEIRKRFPFLEPPDSRQVTDGVRLLTELQAIDPTAPAHLPRKRITPYGRAIVRAALSTPDWRGCSSRRRRTAPSRRCWSSSPPCPSRTFASGRPTSGERADQLHARFRRTGGVPRGVRDDRQKR